MKTFIASYLKIIRFLRVLLKRDSIETACKVCKYWNISLLCLTWDLKLSDPHPMKFFDTPTYKLKTRLKPNFQLGKIVWFAAEFAQRQLMFRLQIPAWWGEEDVLRTISVLSFFLFTSKVLFLVGVKFSNFFFQLLGFSSLSKEFGHLDWSWTFSHF